MRNDEFMAGVPGEGLSDHEREILDFAKRTYHHSAAREEDIIQQFGYRATTYFQRLNNLLDNPHAEAYDPMTVHRYRRIVDDGLTKWGRKPKYSAPTEPGDSQ